MIKIKKMISPGRYELDEDSDLTTSIDTIVQIYCCHENDREYTVQFTDYNMANIKTISNDPKEFLSILKEGTVLEIMVSHSAWLIDFSNSKFTGGPLSFEYERMIDGVYFIDKNTTHIKIYHYGPVDIHDTGLKFMKNNLKMMIINFLRSDEPTSEYMDSFMINNTKFVFSERVKPEFQIKADFFEHKSSTFDIPKLGNLDLT